MEKPYDYFCLNIAIFIAIFVVFIVNTDIAKAQDYRRYQKSERFRSSDYLMKSFNDENDAIFNRGTQVVDLGLNLGIGSDCGRVNFEGTMRSTLQNMLDSKYFGDLGRNVVASSPMLLTCYMSPTWCAIVKQMQLNANFLSQMRLDQCSLVDRYTDSRTEDFYRERQDCVRQKIADNGGDLESAMGSCQNVYNVDLKNWAGKSGGTKTRVNKLIESSAKWAGLTGSEADRATDLVKAFVGDTVVSKGSVSVEYGSRHKALTPEVHLKELREKVQKKLCLDILSRLERDGGRRSVDQLVTESDLRELTPGRGDEVLDKQTIEALSFLPARQRQAACKKLGETIALTTFTNDVNRSVDLLTVAAQNPNLPPERRSEIEEKRKRLKESIDLTLELQRQRNEPLRHVLRDINELGERYRDQYSEEALRSDEAEIRSRQQEQVFGDCGDGILCGNGGH